MAQTKGKAMSEATKKEDAKKEGDSPRVVRISMPIGRYVNEPILDALIARIKTSADRAGTIAELLVVAGTLSASCALRMSDFMAHAKQAYAGAIKSQSRLGDVEKDKLLNG